MQRAEFSQDDLKNPLLDFIQRANDNSVITFTHYKCEATERLKRVDSLYQKVFENEVNPRRPTDHILLSLLGRSHFAYRASVRQAVSGQIPETYMTTRGCLENALYAFFIADDPPKAEVWVRRGENESATRDCKFTFVMRDIKEFLNNKDALLGTWTSMLYERTINLGAHPNVDGIVTTSTVQNVGNKMYGEIRGLDLGTIQWKSCVQCVIDVGICALMLFQLIWKECFKTNGITDILGKLEPESFRKCAETLS